MEVDIRNDSDAEALLGANYTALTLLQSCKNTLDLKMQSQRGED